MKIIREFTSKILHIPGEMVEHFSPYFIDISSFVIRSFPLSNQFYSSSQLIDIRQMYRCSNRENLLQAFQFAQKHYGITQLIDPEGLCHPDKKITNVFSLLQMLIRMNLMRKVSYSTYSIYTKFVQQYPIIPFDKIMIKYENLFIDLNFPMSIV